MGQLRFRVVKSPTQPTAFFSLAAGIPPIRNGSDVKQDLYCNGHRQL